MREIIRLVLVLSLICGFSAAALTMARQSLATRIETQSDFYVRGPALQRLFDRPAEQLLRNKINFTAEGHTYPVFFLSEEGQVKGLAVEAAGTGGYGGDILLMVGIDFETDKIIGMEIIQHSETPGVGSKVEKAGFRKQWQGLPIGAPVRFGQGGDIDAISGATYSSKAVVTGTNVIVDLIARHRDDILKMIKAKQG